MAKKKNRSKKNNQISKIGWLILLAFSLVMVGMIVFALTRKESSPVSTVTADGTKFKQEYSRVVDENRYTYATSEEIEKIITDGTGLVFLGFPECPWCQQLTPIVDEAARAEKLEKIYYLNIREMRELNTETYKKLVDKLKDYLEKDEDGNPRIYVPDVTAFKDGKVVAHFQQESSDQGEEVSPDAFWTEGRRTRAIAQLRDMIGKTR